MHETPLTRRTGSIFRLVLLLALPSLATFGATVHAAPPPAGSPAAKGQDDPGENPLRAADEATRRQALADAWQTYQRACQPCHGSQGSGDGPYAGMLEVRAPDLRRPGKVAAADTARFRRIHDGGASLPQRRWESAMPAFGDELDARQIWGLVLLLEELAKPMTGFSPTTDASEVYASRCAVCHGDKGAGDGPLASELRPRPRDFVRAEYRIRSTAYGDPPLDTDFLGTVANGMQSTAMGAYGLLGMQSLEDLYAHVRGLAAKPFTDDPKVLMNTQTPALPADQLAARGRAVYADAKCADCHGTSGRGNGPQAAKLTNEDGTPAVATNLTKKWHMKATGTAQVLFKVLSSGMNGTPMPGYADTISSDDRWALAYYLESLGRQRRKATPIFTRNVSGELPAEASDAMWKTIPTTFVLLGPQMERAPYWSHPAVDLVEVAAATNDRHIAIALQWDDRTRDVETADVGGDRSLATTLARRDWRLPDQVAIQIPAEPRADDWPMPYLGDAKHPVERWRWSADRSEAGQQEAVVERFAGPGDVPKAPPTASPVRTTAAFADGQWRVVFVADRPKSARGSFPIAVQAWDGSSGETGTWQAFSGWVEINLP